MQRQIDHKQTIKQNVDLWGPFDPYHILCICWIIHTFATLMCILSSRDLDLTENLSVSRMFAI